MEPASREVNAALFCKNWMLSNPVIPEILDTAEPITADEIEIAVLIDIT